MSDATLSRTDHPSSTTPYTVALVLAAWFLAIVWLGTAGAFVGPPGTPPLPLLASFLIPLAAFFALLKWFRPFRDFIMSIDLRLITGIQAWRFTGFEFLALYAYGLLPGIFAFPAALGDMAIAAAAPWMALQLSRNPGFATSKAFRRWNWLGILDLVVAVSLGGLNAFIPLGEVSTQAMAQMPLVLIPGYLVPIFIMLHASALYRTRAKP
jgi:hypothetical protein